MIQQQQTLIASPYIELYNLVVPQDNMLRQINEVIDFSFVYDELKNQYCLDNGRNAIDPIRMFKYLLLKAVFELSDVDIVDMLINQTVKIAIEKGIIQSKAIIVDATHTKARYNQKSPREILLDRSLKLRKAVYKVNESLKAKFPAKNTSGVLKDEIGYCQKLIAVLEAEGGICQLPKIREPLNLLKETVADDLEQLRISEDQDARVGHKSAARKERSRQQPNRYLLL